MSNNPFPSKVAAETLTTADGITLTPTGRYKNRPTFSEAYGDDVFNYEIVRLYNDNSYDSEVGVGKLDDQGNVDRFSTYWFEDRNGDRTNYAGLKTATEFSDLTNVKEFYAQTYIPMVEKKNSGWVLNWTNPNPDFKKYDEATTFKKDISTMRSDSVGAKKVINQEVSFGFPVGLPYPKTLYLQQVSNLSKVGDVVRNGDRLEVFTGDRWKTA